MVRRDENNSDGRRDRQARLAQVTGARDGICLHCRRRFDHPDAPSCSDRGGISLVEVHGRWSRGRIACHLALLAAMAGCRDVAAGWDQHLHAHVLAVAL